MDKLLSVKDTEKARKWLDERIECKELQANRHMANCSPTCKEDHRKRKLGGRSKSKELVEDYVSPYNREMLASGLPLKTLISGTKDNFMTEKKKSKKNPNKNKSASKRKKTDPQEFKLRTASRSRSRSPSNDRNNDKSKSKNKSPSKKRRMTEMSISEFKDGKRYTKTAPRQTRRDQERSKSKSKSQSNSRSRSNSRSSRKPLKQISISNFSASPSKKNANK